MRNVLLTAAALVTLSGCTAYGGYGSGVSLGISSGYGYGTNGYGYGQYGYDNNCILYDRYGRPYYNCDSYYGGGGYSQSRLVYYYPGYTYRQGYYYDQSNRRFEGQLLYREHYLHNQYRRHYRRR